MIISIAIIKPKIVPSVEIGITGFNIPPKLPMYEAAECTSLGKPVESGKIWTMNPRMNVPAAKNASYIMFVFREYL